ncbi:MAG TPA: hypothetical protein VFU28_12780 [Vicinamibacterales bacterium]|nr:hypothetical protein [Vicinamibacterales bacterium]
MNDKESSRVQSEFTIPASLDYDEVLNKAREYFYSLDPNIIGVNIGPRRVKQYVQPNEYALVVYVLEKRPQGDLDPAKVIPKEFMGIGTDVHAPMSADAAKVTGDFLADREIENDLSAVDWGRLHDLAVSTDLPPTFPLATRVQDFGDVCVVENDGTVVKTHPDGTEYIDFFRAYQLFRTLHGDDYDFVTFFVDNAMGVSSGLTSFYGAIYQDVTGIGLGTSNRSERWRKVTSRLQGFHFVNQSHFASWRYVMLQEFGHRFAAFAKYRDPATGVTRTDHFVSGFPGHWGEILDVDRSPMHYAPINWIELPNGEFSKVILTSDERTYCNLDLYLMGLLGPDAVGQISLLRNLNPTGVDPAPFTATPVRLSVQNFIAQEGPRIPNVSEAQKCWRDAFIVLTNDTQKVHDLVDTVDSLRLRFERDFIEATKGRGRVDTVLGVRTGHAADFTIVSPGRQGFGDDEVYLKSIEPNVPFKGRAKDFGFSCPNVNASEAAVLMFQSRDVDFSTNVIAINGRNVSGGIPVSPNKDAWNGNVMLIGAGILREFDNELHVESRDTAGGSEGDIDDFILDNVVVMYKTR